MLIQPANLYHSVLPEEQGNPLTSNVFSSLLAICPKVLQSSFHARFLYERRKGILLKRLMD